MLSACDQQVPCEGARRTWLGVNTQESCLAASPTITYPLPGDKLTDIALGPTPQTIDHDITCKEYGVLLS